MRPCSACKQMAELSELSAQSAQFMLLLQRVSFHSMISFTCNNDFCNDQGRFQYSAQTTLQHSQFYLEKESAITLYGV